MGLDSHVMIDRQQEGRPYFRETLFHILSAVQYCNQFFKASVVLYLEPKNYGQNRTVVVIRLA